MSFYTAYTQDVTTESIGEITDMMIQDLIIRSFMMMTGTMVLGLVFLTLL